jgi:hypothetical protein
MQMLSQAVIQFCLLLPAIPGPEDLFGHDYSAKKAALWSREPGIL